MKLKWGEKMNFSTKPASRNGRDLIFDFLSPPLSPCPPVPILIFSNFWHLRFDLIFDTLWCASNAYFEPSRSFIVLWLVHYRTPLFVKTVPDRFFPVTFENLLTMKSMFWAVMLVVVKIALAEVTILKAVQTIYDRSPKLRIKGSGFDADEHDILITLGSQNQPPLKLGKDFTLTKDDDGLILKLLSVRRWEQTPNLSYNNVCIVLPRSNHRNHDASKFSKITM